MPIKDVDLKIKIMKDLLDRYQQAEKESQLLLSHIKTLETILKELL